jgi:hypothetical protein
VQAAEQTDSESKDMRSEEREGKGGGEKRDAQDQVAAAELPVILPSSSCSGNLLLGESTEKRLQRERWLLSVSLCDEDKKGFLPS